MPHFLGPKEDQPREKRQQEREARIDQHRWPDMVFDTHSYEKRIKRECEPYPENHAQHPSREKSPIYIEYGIAGQLAHAQKDQTERYDGFGSPKSNHVYGIPLSSSCTPLD